MLLRGRASLRRKSRTAVRLLWVVATACSQLGGDAQAGDFRFGGKSTPPHTQLRDRYESRVAKTILSLRLGLEPSVLLKTLHRLERNGKARKLFKDIVRQAKHRRDKSEFLGLLCGVFTKTEDEAQLETVLADVLELGRGVDGLNSLLFKGTKESHPFSEDIGRGFELQVAAWFHRRLQKEIRMALNSELAGYEVDVQLSTERGPFGAIEAKGTTKPDMGNAIRIGLKQGRGHFVRTGTPVAVALRGEPDRVKQVIEEFLGGYGQKYLEVPFDVLAFAGVNGTFEAKRVASNYPVNLQQIIKKWNGDKKASFDMGRALGNVELMKGVMDSLFSGGQSL